MQKSIVIDASNQPEKFIKKRTKNKDKKRRRNRYRSHLNFQGRDADCWIGKAVQARPYFLFGLEQGILQKNFWREIGIPRVNQI